MGIFDNGEIHVPTLHIFYSDVGKLYVSKIISDFT